MDHVFLISIVSQCDSEAVSEPSLAAQEDATGRARERVWLSARPQGSDCSAQGQLSSMCVYHVP